MKVLFIGRANAVRSQMAEAYYNVLTGTTDATSAGVDLWSAGDDFAVPSLVHEVMQEEGIALSSARRKWIGEDMVEAADRIIALVDRPLPEYVRRSSKITYWNDLPEIADSSIESYRQVRDMIRTKVDGLRAS